MIITWIAFVKNNSRSFIIYFEKLQLRKNSFGGFRILENFTQRFVFIKVETGYIVEFRTSKNQFHVRENGKITQNTFLFTLAFSHYLLPDEDVYLKELRRISLEADSLDVYNKASYSLARYYCNHNQKDSLFALLDQVKSIVVKRKAEPNVIFDIRSRICRLYLINQEYEMAMNEVVSLLQDVEKADYEQGLIFANEHLGLIFLLIGRNKEAIAPLKKSLSLLQKKGDQLSLEIEILSYISIAFMHLNELDDMKSLLEYYQERLERSVHFDQPSSAVEELVHKSSHCMFYSLWLNYYVAKKMKKEAREILPKAALYVKEITDPGYTSVYYLAMARYYQLLQEYEKAIGAIDTTLQLDYSIADKIDSTYSSYEALLSLCRYYCNTYKLG